MTRVFSGIQPTGHLTLGNYLGAMRRWVELDQHRADSVFCVVDLHALTVDHDPARVRRLSRQTATLLLAAGLDPEVCTVFLQSHVDEHTRLSYLLECVATDGEMRRMIQYKEKAAKERERGGSVRLSLLTYPVLMAADILLYRAELVPVGEDQVQHLELSREIARRWNAKFGVDYFPEPKPLLTTTRRVMGLDGQAKMSKSMGNTIGLLESPERVWEKLRPAVTDPARVRRTDPGTPEVCNIYHLHQAFSDAPTVERVAHNCRTAGWGCIECKRVLFESMERELAPVRARAAELAAAPDRVTEILEAGAARCRAIAEETMRAVRERMGLR